MGMSCGSYTAGSRSPDNRGRACDDDDARRAISLRDVPDQIDPVNARKPQPL